MPNGIVYFYNRSGGFGVIVPDDGGADAFVHANALARADIAVLTRGQAVSYDLRTDCRGQRSACSVRLMTSSMLPVG